MNKATPSTNYSNTSDSRKLHQSNEDAASRNQKHHQKSHNTQKKDGAINMHEVSGFLLYSSYFAWKRKIETTLLPHDLTHVQFMLLMSLAFLKKDGAYVSQNDLAKFLSFDVTMTSQVLRTLEKRGLLKRSQKEGNERSKFSELTDAGLSKIQDAGKDFVAAEECFFANLGNDQEQFDKYLQEICR